MHPIMEQLRKLSLAEKKQILDELWDDIEREPGFATMPGWYREELDRRIAEMDADPKGGLTEQEFWSQIRARRAP